MGIPVCLLIDENLYESITGNTVKNNCFFLKTILIFFKFICENDPFDENGRVKVFRNCTMNCKSLQLNATFIDKYGLFVRSEEIWHEEKGENKTFVYVGPRSCQSSQMDSGFILENFNRKETGIPWCSWQENGTIANRIFFLSSMFLRVVRLCPSPIFWNHARSKKHVS